jgi:type I restriction enzyme S subunit
LNPTLFDIPGDGWHDRYLRLRDDPRFEDRRQQSDLLWQSFMPYAEPTFKEEFARQPQKRYWEMYLGCHVLQIEFRLHPKTDQLGPDLCFDTTEFRVWIELTAVDEGTGADAVPKVAQHSGHDPIPDDRIILRFTNAVAEKHKRLLSYQDRGLVSRNDAYIVAVNAAEIEMSLFDFDYPIPLIVKALYPLGQHVMRIDPAQERVVEEGYQFRPAIQKESGSDVPTNVFLDPAYSGISGVIYSLAAFWEFPTRSVNDLLYVHNAIASTPMPPGWMKAGKDCWRENDHWTIRPNQQFA